MEKFNRLSRKQRKALYKSSKAKTALIMALALLLMVVIYNQFNNISEKIQSTFSSYDNSKFYTDADSIIVQVSRLFDFNRELEVVKGEKSINESVHYSVQPWPRQLPYVYYSKVVTEAARKYGFIVECVESAKNNSMICTIRPGDSSANLKIIVTVEKRRGIKLRNRNIAFIIENIGDLRAESLDLMLNAGFHFSYIGDTETYPTGEVKKRLSGSGISTILKIPGDFRKLMFLRTAGSVKGRKNNQKEIDWTEKLFDLHPNVQTFYFDPIVNFPSDSLTMVLKTSAKRNLKYIYDGSSTNLADSLAYSLGLSIVKYHVDMDLREKTPDLFAPELFSKILGNEKTDNIVILINAKNINPEKLISLWEILGNLGINRLSCMKLFESVESL